MKLNTLFRRVRQAVAISAMIRNYNLEKVPTALCLDGISPMFPTIPTVGNLQDNSSKDSNGQLWACFFNKEGNRFFYATEDRQTTWNRPKDYDMINERRCFVAHCIEQQLQLREREAQEINTYICGTLKSLPRTTYIGTFFAIKPEEIETLVSDVCVLYFKQMLDEKMMENEDHKRLRPNSSWEAANRLLQHEARYNLIPRPSERKAIFNQWKETAYSRAEQMRQAITERESLRWRAELEKNSAFTMDMTFEQAQTQFGTLPFWTQTNGDLKVIYSGALSLLKEEKKTADEAKRRANLEQLNEILKDMPNITHETTWRQVQRLLGSNPEFTKNADLMSMDKEDALCVFSAHIRILLDEYRKTRDLQAKGSERRERKIRDRFDNLLNELRRSGLINLKSKWKEISPVICKEDAFLDMFHQPGSTPIDHFKFFMMDWNNEFSQNLKTVIEILDEEDFEITLSTSFENFVLKIRQNKAFGKLSSMNLPYIYDHLMHEAIEQASKHENANENLRAPFLAELSRLEESHEIDLENKETIITYFKKKWKIAGNVESVMMSVVTDYVAKADATESDVEDGQIVNKRRSSATSEELPSVTSPTPSSRHEDEPAPKRKKRSKKHSRSHGEKKSRRARREGERKHHSRSRSPRHQRSQSKEQRSEKE